ncbi:MAG: PilZ domain-containing protein [Deltaproteobacteria bacterium]|nr:PilZ domain-containing protein [Deltaproteobacteria bacterium]MCB9787241.1 PilZ domain-containing protein [Deltaproteobacteria bacterium]
MGRRSRYRVSVDTVDPVKVTLAVRGWPPIGVQIRNANARGIAVDMGADSHIPTSPGNLVELTVWLVMRHRAVVVPAEIVSATEQGDRRRLGLRFTEPDAVDRELAHDLGVVFNRRETPRHPVRSFTPVTLCPADDPHGPAVYATAFDLSLGGVGVSMAPMDDGRLAGAVRFQAEIELDETHGKLTTQVALRHRRLSGGRVSYGLRFAPDDDQALAAIQSAVGAFIAHDAA